MPVSIYTPGLGASETLRALSGRLHVGEQAPVVKRRVPFDPLDAYHAVVLAPVHVAAIPPAIAREALVSKVASTAYLCSTHKRRRVRCNVAARFRNWHLLEATAGVAPTRGESQ